MDTETQPRSLREARRKRRLKAYELAERIRVDAGTVSRWENGHVTPQGPTRRLLAIELEVPVETVDSWFPAAA